MLGLGRVGRPNHVPKRRDRIGTGEHHRHAGTRCHEADQRRIERTLAVHGVECAGFVSTQANDARRRDAKTSLFEVRDDFAREPAPQRVRLDDGQCAVEMA